jgi:hypothetical protein
LLFDRDTGGQPTAPPGITAEAPGRGELGVHERPRRLGQGPAQRREHHAPVIRLLPLVFLAIEALPGGGTGVRRHRGHADVPGAVALVARGRQRDQHMV